jgi:hypothetical protein
MTRLSYLMKIGHIQKVSLALHVVVLIVPLGLHVLVSSFIGMKRSGTIPVGSHRLPMTLNNNMLIGNSLRNEGKVRV